MNLEEADICGNDDFTVLPKRTEEAIWLLSKQRHECANCLCKIRNDVAIWSCNRCFCVFHLYCIKKWARQGKNGVGSSFRCPLCQVMHPPALGYFCFCGKVKDPVYDPHITPHSCGHACGKERPFCKHPCPLPCHPGPCPLCLAVAGPRPCPCGATTYTWRCGQPDPQKTCGNICSKPLNCGTHGCKQQCHIGECKPCCEKTRVRCCCQQQERDLPCGSVGFSCGALCGKTLRCGVHMCDLLCHSGSCPPCSQDPSIIFSCPCGSVPLEVTRTHCTDPIPTCSNICGHLLNCKHHTCQELCHAGACGPCKQRVLSKCVCGLTQNLVSCEMRDGYFCSKVCKTTLSCGKHECKAFCCPARKQPNSAVHLRQQICGRKLTCGHKCLENCHRGSCPPCVHVVSERLFCRCGAESLMPPQPCGTPPPRCDRPCSLERPCGHPQTKHPCHYGDCSPCVFHVERQCAGGHTVLRNVLCSAEFVFCGGQCGKLLPCGHECLRNCHFGPCVDEKHRCVQLCGKIFSDCGHTCKAKCHLPEKCPQCTELFERRCECGRRRINASCKRFMSHLNKNSSESFDLKCNTDCFVERRLEVLGGRVKRTTTPLTPPDIKYSLFLWDVATNKLAWVQKVEEELDQFVTDKALCKCLKPMPAEKRAVVHSLSQYYHIFSESVDTEPNRSCMLTKTPKTHIPALLLSAAIADPKRHDPLKFIQELSENTELLPSRVIIIKGENVNAILVSRLLKDYAGEFVCEAEEVLPDSRNKQVRVFFSHQIKQQQAYGHLCRIMPPFEFFLFLGNSNRHSLKTKNPATATSWAKSVWSVKK